MSRVKGTCVVSLLLIVSALGSAGRADEAAPLREEVLSLFKRLDELGRNKIMDAKFVSLSYLVQNLGAPPSEPQQKVTESCWVLAEDDSSATVLQSDLIPWTYPKRSAATIPQSWNPATIKFDSLVPTDFEEKCKELAAKPAVGLEGERASSRLRDPGPSYWLLVAHAAWKRGLVDYCDPILSRHPKYNENVAGFAKAAWDDLAWLHFLRGVNLLMYADRKEVLPHLQIVVKIAPESEYAVQAKDLLPHLERLIRAEQNARQEPPAEEAKLNDDQRAKRYVAQLPDLHCMQFSQPGFIQPFMTITDGKPNPNPPTARLRSMGMAAVPALIEALADDTPTRTVYHWRDFAHSRLVWRVSDFAWTILRDITKKDFGYRQVVGFTLSTMEPEEKRVAIAEIKKWYAENKNLSPDDKMFAFFSSASPEDWVTAGEYFLKSRDKRAVPALLEKIPQARDFDKGKLCELVAKFGDVSAKKTIDSVMRNATEHGDRLGAAIALWTLGDESGIPIVINYVKADEQRYGSWDEPIWFLMRTKSERGIQAMQEIVSTASAQRAGEVIRFITAAISGDLWSAPREPAGCLEICPVLIAGMNRADDTGGTINDVKVRIKDIAAKGFVLLRDGSSDRFGGRFVEIDPKVFNEVEPDSAKRDAQIDKLKEWFAQNKDKLIWDSSKKRLSLKP
jgi:hypothetical protein